jgi:hypothetical protein
MGTGYVSPIVSALDPAGSTNPIIGDTNPSLDALTAYSRLRSVRTASAMAGD